MSKKIITSTVSSIPKCISVSKNGQLRIKIHAKPGSKQNSIVGISDDCVDVQIAAPPREGEANTELVKYMSYVLDIKKGKLNLESGLKSRTKVLSINEDTTIESIYEKIKSHTEED